MIKYVIWCDERNANAIVASSKEEAIRAFDQETVRYNKTYNVDCMTVAEMLEEDPTADFDELINGCDFVYCQKFEGTEEEVISQVETIIKALAEEE